MNILWVQVCANLPDHPKTTALAETLHLSCAKLDGNAAAVGLLVRLWTWAIQSKPDGCLSGCSPRAIALATRFRGKPDVLVDALISTGWIDQDDGDLYLHNWEQYAKLFMDKDQERREQNRRAQQACRARRREKKRLEAEKAASNLTTSPIAPSALAPSAPMMSPIAPSALVQSVPTTSPTALSDLVSQVPTTSPTESGLVLGAGDGMQLVSQSAGDCQHDVSMTNPPTLPIPIQEPVQEMQQQKKDALAVTPVTPVLVDRTPPKSHDVNVTGFPVIPVGDDPAAIADPVWQALSGLRVFYEAKFNQLLPQNIVQQRLIPCLQQGMQPALIQAVMDQSDEKSVKSPPAYIFRMLGYLQQDRILTVDAWQASRHCQTKGRRKNGTYSKRKPGEYDLVTAQLGG